jgi:hypothetical protein
VFGANSGYAFNVTTAESRFSSDLTVGNTLDVMGSANVADQLDVDDDLFVGDGASTYSQILFYKMRPTTVYDSILYMDGDTVFLGPFPSTVNNWTRNAANGYLYPSTITDRVGIGTSTPQASLHVDGNDIFTDVSSVTSSTNTTLGIDAYGAGTSSGTNNSFMGYRAAYSATSAEQNVGTGNYTLYSITTGKYNTVSGYAAGYDITTGQYNTLLGYGAGENITGSDNTIIGARAGLAAIGGKNTIIGSEAGTSIAAGDTANVFIGFDAGSQETGSDKLYIDNTNTTTPLIWGDFNTNDIIFTADVQVDGTLSQDMGTITDNDATPDVTGYNILRYAGSSNSVTITDLDNPTAGTIYYILGNSDTYTVTINDAGNFTLAGNVTLGSGDVLTLLCFEDNNYIEVTRSDN